MDNYVENQYAPTDKQLGTPYFKAYLYSLSLRPVKEKPPVLVTPKTKRTFVLILILILMVAIIAVYALSFLGVMPFGVYKNVVGEASDEEAIEEEDDEAGTDADIPGDTEIGVDDIIWSLLKSFSMEVSEDQQITFYQDIFGSTEEGVASRADDAETFTLIGFYLVPVSILLTVILAIFILIKTISGLASPKRRKFPYITLVLLLFTLLGLVGGFIWANLPIGEMMTYMFSGPGIVMGISLIIVLGIEILALILSFFAYKSKKKCQPYYLFEDGSTYPAE